MKKETHDTGKVQDRQQFQVVGIGASAGGLDAFKELIHAIPDKPGMAFILMQHLDPAYESALAEILQRETELTVTNLAQPVLVEPDRIYVVPADKLLVVNDGILDLEQRPSDVTPLYPIDIFFTALAEMFQSNAIGVLLSGMGSDGTIGLGKIKDNGGVTIVQTPSSAKYGSMPEHAIRAEAVDFELAPAAIPQQLLKVDNTLKIIPETGNYTAPDGAEEGHFKDILHLLKLRSAVDFTYYKQTTIRRRILRRMLVNKTDEVGEYLALLEQNPAEQDLLYQDLLIPVTSFFRDPAIFENLCRQVLPDLFENKKTAFPLRIWVAGCSTGEEAYSIAICLHEFLGETIAGIKLQLFATDISNKAIHKARSGIYSARELSGISKSRLAAYFTKMDGHYQVKKNIRDLCVFAKHNFLSDPPFAKMEFISCRNVLIYMDTYLQKKALATFHYALNEKGMLLLGKSETANNSPELFTVVQKPDKLYIRKALVGKNDRLILDPGEKSSRPLGNERQYDTSRKEDFHKNADDILLAKYTPAGVVVNQHFEIVQFRGSTGPYLEAAPGKASLNILKMAREGLPFEIRAALHKARDAKEIITKAGIPVNDGSTLVSIEVVPLLQTIEPHYLILFRHENIPSAESQATAGALFLEADSPEHQRIKQLEKDLAQIREDMRTITEDQEAANEELQSANEELLSGSEELQSLNEELETSKEELQSTNEELMTVNQELDDRNEQYNRSRQYAEAVIATIHEPLLVLNRDLRIKSANNSFYKIFGLRESDIIGRILFELQENSWNLPELRNMLLQLQTGQVNQIVKEVSLEVSALGKRIMLLNARPVNELGNEQLFLLAFEDVTFAREESNRLIESAHKLKLELNLIENFFLQAPAMFCILQGPTHVFEFINPRYTQVSGGLELKGKRFDEAFPEFENEGYKKILDDVYKTGRPFLGREMKANHFPGSAYGEAIYVDISCQSYRNDSGEIEGVLFFSYEVSEQVQNRKKVERNAEDLEQKISERTSMLQASNHALEISNKNLQEFASIASHDLQEPLRKIKTFTSILKDRYRESLPAEVGELVTKTQQSANRMSSLIKDVLNYSRVVVPENSFEPTDLNKILQNVTGDFDLLMEEKSAVIHVQPRLPVIDAVPLQMNQLFYNLINNALKFTSKNRTPVINITGGLLTDEEITIYKELQPSRKYAYIQVKDNGIGFDQQFAEQIFSIFERLNAASEYEGTGIGLALCRKIVNNHHGYIRAEGEEDKGTSFYIILPIKQ